MRESGRRLAEIFSKIPSFLKRGMRELDLAAEMEYHLRKSGSEGAIRLSLSGRRSSALHPRAPAQRILAASTDL